MILKKGIILNDELLRQDSSKVRSIYFHYEALRIKNSYTVFVKKIIPLRKKSKSQKNEILIFFHDVGESHLKYQNFFEGIVGNDTNEKNNLEIWLIDLLGHGQSSGARGNIQNQIYYQDLFEQLFSNHNLHKELKKSQKNYIWGNGFGMTIALYSYLHLKVSGFSFEGFSLSFIMSNPKSFQENYEHRNDNFWRAITRKVVLSPFFESVPYINSLEVKFPNQFLATENDLPMDGSNSIKKISLTTWKVLRTMDQFIQKYLYYIEAPLYFIDSRGEPWPDMFLDLLKRKVGEHNFFIWKVDGRRGLLFQQDCNFCFKEMIQSHQL